jgi:hypothetical protein
MRPYCAFPGAIRTILRTFHIHGANSANRGMFRASVPSILRCSLGEFTRLRCVWGNGVRERGGEPSGGGGGGRVCDAVRPAGIGL